MPESVADPLFLLGFLIVVVFLLALDLGVLHRKAHVVGFARLSCGASYGLLFPSRSALTSTSNSVQPKGWSFSPATSSSTPSALTTSSFLSCSSSYFAVPPRLHHRVLFWGIIGALIMRATFILAGAALLEMFHWIIYIFGAFLVFTGYKILRQGETEVHPERNPVVRLFQRFVPLVS